MNSPENDVTPTPEPFLPGLAPVFKALADGAGPLLDMAPGSAVLVAAMFASAFAGNALRLDLPLRPRTRTNTHAIFAGDSRKEAITLFRLLRLPIENYVTEVLDAAASYTGSRRLMQRELVRSREGLSKLEHRAAVLRDMIEQGQKHDAEKDLQALAAKLGLRYAAPEALRRHLAALRLCLGQLLFVSPMEVADISAWKTHSLDGHVTEYLVDGGEIQRLLGLHPRHLAQLAQFRRESCRSRVLEAHGGVIGGTPRPSTLWFADAAEVDDLYRNPRLRQHRYADPFVVIRLPEAPSDDEVAPHFLSAWNGFALVLLHRRLQARQLAMTLVPDAWIFLENWLRDYLPESEWYAEHVALPSLATVAAMNACGRNDDLEFRISLVIELVDVEVAAALLGPELQATVLLPGKRDEVAKPQPVPKNLESVLAKLAAKGPLTRRELHRSFNRMTADELNPLLQEGIQLGLVEVCAGKYRATAST